MRHTRHAQQKLGEEGSSDRATGVAENRSQHSRSDSFTHTILDKDKIEAESSLPNPQLLTPRNRNYITSIPLLFPLTHTIPLPHPSPSQIRNENAMRKTSNPETVPE